MASGITQLEAMAQGMPVIASMNCGPVVEDRVNGLLLDDLSPETIAGSIEELAGNDDFLRFLQDNAGKTVGNYSAEKLSANYLDQLRF